MPILLATSMRTILKGTMADTEYIKQVRYPDGQLRVEIDTEVGDVTRFLVQLERLVDGEPNVVARFDHD